MTSDGGACSPRRTRKRATDSHNGDLSHSEEIEVVEETKSEEEEEKIVTTGKKGVAVLVQWLPDYVKTNYHVVNTNMKVIVIAGLPYDYLAVTSFSYPKFLKLNPIGFVPVLVDGDSVIVYSFAIIRSDSVTHFFFSFTSLLHFLISSKSHIQYLEDKYPDPPLHIHQRAINFQKYIGEKVGVDEKLPWTQSVIGKGFMGEFKLKYHCFISSPW
ncbi:Glutathione S-transferase zeta class [Glycine soja]